MAVTIRKFSRFSRTLCTKSSKKTSHSNLQVNERQMCCVVGFIAHGRCFYQAWKLSACICNIKITPLWFYNKITVITVLFVLVKIHLGPGPGSDADSRYLCKTSRFCFCLSSSNLWARKIPANTLKGRLLGLLRCCLQNTF